MGLEYTKGREVTEAIDHDEVADKDLRAGEEGSFWDCGLGVFGGGLFGFGAHKWFLCC